MPDFYEIDFLPVHTSKSGDAIAMRYQIGANWWVPVVDGGFTSTAPDLANLIRQTYGTNLINFMVVTHPDKDHAEGLAPILESFDVGELWMLRPWEYAEILLPHFARYSSAESLAQRLREEYPYIAELERIAVSRSIPIHRPFQGERIGAFTVLAPSPAPACASSAFPAPVSQASLSVWPRRKRLKMASLMDFGPMRWAPRTPSAAESAKSSLTSGAAHRAGGAGYENAHALRVAMASDVPTRSFSPEVSPSALSTRSSSTCSELNVPAAARFLDMGGTSPLRVPRIGPAFRFARRAKISARSAEPWPVPCGLLRWTAMEQTR
jgi:hypothetical protein